MERIHDSGLPEDVVELWKENDWVIYYSRQTECVHIYPTTYHPLALAISPKELNELMGQIRLINAASPHKDDPELLNKGGVESNPNQEKKQITLEPLKGFTLFQHVQLLLATGVLPQRCEMKWIQMDEREDLGQEKH